MHGLDKSQLLLCRVLRRSQLSSDGVIALLQITAGQNAERTRNHGVLTVNKYIFNTTPISKAWEMSQKSGQKDFKSQRTEKSLARFCVLLMTDKL